MKYWKLLLVSVLFVGCKSANTEGFSPKLDSACMPVIENFFEKLASQRDQLAIDDLLGAMVAINNKDSVTIEMKNRFLALRQIGGPFSGKSLLKRKAINDEVAIYSYLAKYERNFFRFVFIFYNNGTETRIYKFSFDNELGSELDQSLKLYM